MQTHAGQQAPKVDAKVSIQDVLVIAKTSRTNANPVGEFHSSLTTETSDQRIDRLYGYINSLVVQAADRHKSENVNNGKLKPDCMNNVTRLITNEFFFYTQAPLSIAEFEKLQQKIFALAKSQPENLHLVLGTFAVMTADNKVMNVAVSLQCGKQPVLNLVVKNHPSAIDPIYKQADGKVIQNIDARRGHHVENEKPIMIDGVKYYFDFNNVFQCKTAGGVGFQLCIEICLDHASGLAIKNLEEMIKRELFIRSKAKIVEQISRQCSHVVISNTISLEDNYCVGAVTHADPGIRNLVDFKKGAIVLGRNDDDHPVFGSPCKLIMTKSTPCSLLPAELQTILDKAIERYHKLAVVNRGVLAKFSFEDADNYLDHIIVTDSVLAAAYFEAEPISMILRPASDTSNDVVMDVKMPHLAPPDDVKSIPIDDKFALSVNGKEYKSFTQYARAFILAEELKCLGVSNDQFIGFNDYVARSNLWGVFDEMEEKIKEQDIGSYVVAPSALRGEDYLTVKLKSDAVNVQELEYRLCRGELYRLTDYGEEEVASIATDINNIMFIKGVEASEYKLTDSEIRNYLRDQIPNQEMADAMFQEIMYSQRDLPKFREQAIKKFNADLITNWRNIKNSGLSREAAIASYVEVSLQLQVALLETLNKHLIEYMEPYTRRLNQAQNNISAKTSELGVFAIPVHHSDKSAPQPVGEQPSPQSSKK